ncbi:hypothetical protein Glove_91g98 [Diversispora epigaea]|uniref:Uncharacterized protein n=1 Tax=Diversispora epigaea TaxID=1348612 RepID=A0A397JF34_9GLOM|nr:hypothetical protein Glove_91g98 [Diversispora epigaea]
MQSKLDLLKQENVRLMARITELKQRKSENAKLKTKKILLNMQSKLDLLKQENVRLMARITELKQRKSENAKLKTKYPKLIVNKTAIISTSDIAQHKYTNTSQTIHIEPKSSEDKEIDNFLDLTYKDTIRKLLTLSNSIEVNDDESGQRLAQLFSDAEIAEDTVAEIKTKTGVTEKIARSQVKDWAKL